MEEIRKYATAYRVLSDAKKREHYDRTGFHLLETELAAGMHPVAEKVEGFWGGANVGDMIDVASIVLEIFSNKAD